MVKHAKGLLLCFVLAVLARCPPPNPAFDHLAPLHQQPRRGLVGTVGQVGRQPSRVQARHLPCQCPQRLLAQVRSFPVARSAVVFGTAAIIITPLVIAALVIGSPISSRVNVPFGTPLFPSVPTGVAGQVGEKAPLEKSAPPIVILFTVTNNTTTHIVAIASVYVVAIITVYIVGIAIVYIFVIIIVVIIIIGAIRFFSASLVPIVVVVPVVDFKRAPVGIVVTARRCHNSRGLDIFSCSTHGGG
mmetsp:Transcript_60192/g.120746  ORF Transcript_60192/g.120746 Transcript_60192/m.120746 type:complete len:245 (-) Transcript_60192:659-1393(-)